MTDDNPELRDVYSRHLDVLRASFAHVTTALESLTEVGWAGLTPHLTAEKGLLGYAIQNLEEKLAATSGGGQTMPDRDDTELTFSKFRATNSARCSRWHPGFPDSGEWTGADWSNAMCGEAGEVANVVKKLRRIETGHLGAVDPAREELIDQLADECGDVLAYLDLLAAYYGIDLAKAAARKFNRVSGHEGFPERLPHEGRGVRNA